MISTNRRSTKAPIWWSFIFLIRRLVVAAFTVFVQHFRLLQVTAIMYSALGGASFIVICWPFEDKILNIVELINEVFLLVNSYFALLMCDIIQDRETSDQLGGRYYYALVLITGLNICIATATIITRQLQAYWRRREHAEFIERIRIRLEERRKAQEAALKQRIDELRLRKIDILKLGDVPGYPNDLEDSSEENKENTDDD